MKILPSFKNPLPLAVIYSLLLLVAAYGKFFYPSKYFEILDRGVSFFEVALVVMLFYFRKTWLMWCFVALINSLWGGYALFWHRLNLPCECLGSLFPLPTFVSLLFDGSFFLLSLWMAYVLGAQRKALILTVASGCIAVVLGFFFAFFLYNHL